MLVRLSILAEVYVLQWFSRVSSGTPKVGIALYLNEKLLEVTIGVCRSVQRVLGKCLCTRNNYCTYYMPRIEFALAI